MGLAQKGKFNTPKPAEIKRFKAILPAVLSNEAKNHFLLGFRRGGKQTDESRSGWKKLSSGYEARKRKDGKPTTINVDTSTLKGDLDVRSTTFKRSVVGFLDVDYAQYVNEEREVVGPSKALEKEMDKTILNELNKLFKK